VKDKPCQYPGLVPKAKKETLGKTGREGGGQGKIPKSDLTITLGVEREAIELRRSDAMHVENCFLLSKT